MTPAYIDFLKQGIEVNDEVLVLGKYEGTFTSLEGDRAIVYCPEYNEKEPWLITHISNVVLLHKRVSN